MRELCGKKSYAAIPLADFSKDFYLTQLLNASAVIVDENDVGTYIDRAANFKAVVTGDAVTINRKFKDPITYQFRGFMVQCLNEMPRVKIIGFILQKTDFHSIYKVLYRSGTEVYQTGLLTQTGSAGIRIT